jgi:predicted lysophospholipase L1 biosynthesis ABC-type transport system permease subunit
MLKQWLTRLRLLLAPKPHREIDEELQFHLEQQSQPNIAAGMTPQEARRQAVIAFGGVERAKEESHQQRPSFYIETVVQDIRYALRGFARNPAFTLTILVTLMLGIGATTAVFSIVDRIPLTEVVASRLVRPTSVVVIRSSLPPDQTSRWIRSQVAALDPTLPVDIATLRQRVAKLADQPRFQTTLVSFFAATGLVLAMIRLYGVIAYLVAQRTQEIGVRMALGADKGDILRLVMGRSLRLIVSGIAVGLVTALAATRVLSSLLYSIGPHDPVTFGVVTLLLVLVAIVAALIPARSATSVNPIVAL